MVSMYDDEAMKHSFASDSDQLEIGVEFVAQMYKIRIDVTQN